MWTTVEINGKAADAFIPEDKISDHAILYLHAHGEEHLSEKAGFTELFERFRYPVLCPRGKKSWWLDRVCRDFDDELTPMQFLRSNVVNWLEENWNVQPPRIALLGISMGGQGALNLAYRDALTFPVVAAISSAVELHKAYGHGFPIDEMFESAEEARQESVALHLHPLNWPKHQFFACDPMDPTWFEGNEILASKLSSSGVPYECDLKTSRGGHDWSYFTPMAEQALAFIQDAFRHSADSRA